MPVITRALLRKRAEHNEGMITTLEELTLHQEELENINEVLGSTCRKVKILYLQNNIINRIENLVHLKELVYLNLALNNIAKIEGLQKCEFLSKLDLTVNFVDVDALEESMDHLASRKNLIDLYMMGNPSQANCSGFNSYVIAKLPQLKTLDGTEITRSMQIQARQKLPQLEIELRTLATEKRREKAEKAAERLSAEGDKAEQKSSGGSSSSTTKGNEALDCDEEIIREDDINDRDQMTDNTPEVRQEIYRDLAQQKKEKADRDKAQQPRERDYEKEQLESIEATRKKEAELEINEIKQKNEGGWDFRWDEEIRKSDISLEVMVPRHLDSSLIDVDVHPMYISIVIKSKLLRLRLPVEVKAGESKCQRSKTTGSLLIIMPKVNPKETGLYVRDGEQPLTTVFHRNNERIKKTTSVTTIKQTKKMSLHDQMLADAMNSGGGNTDVTTQTTQTVQKLELSSTPTVPLSTTLSNIARKPRVNSTPDQIQPTFTLDNVEPNAHGGKTGIVGIQEI